MPNSTDEAEDRHSNFYDAWVNLGTLTIADPFLPDAQRILTNR